MSEQHDSPPRRPSSWSAAISQLPGYPEEDKPKLPPLSGAAREVSSGGSEDDDAEAERGAP